MLGKGNGRRRVVKQGVQKQKPRRKSKKSIFTQLAELLPRKYHAKLYETAENCFKLLGYYCCKMCVVALSVNDEGRFVMTESSRHRIVHYSLVVLLFARVVQQAVSLVVETTSQSLDLTMILCVGTFLAYIGCFGISVSQVFKPQETLQLLNTLPLMMQLNLNDGGRKLGVLESPMSVVLVFSLIIVMIVATIVVLSLNFIVESLPVSLYHLVNKTGIPSLWPSVPTIGWKILLLLVEIPIIVQALMTTTWAAITLVAIMNVCNFSTDNLRKTPEGSTSSWLELRRRFFVFQVFFKLCNSWVRFMIVPAVTTVSACIVISLYLAIRPTDLPLFIYLCLPCIGVSEFIILFALVFQIIGTGSDTELVVGILTTSSHENFGKIAAKKSLYQKKVLRATRALAFDVGDFMDFSLDVAVGMWDEILNQLLFLLSM